MAHLEPLLGGLREDIPDGTHKPRLQGLHLVVGGLEGGLLHKALGVVHKAAIGRASRGNSSTVETHAKAMGSVVVVRNHKGELGGPSRTRDGVLRWL